MNEVVTIEGAWISEANAWVSETIQLEGDCYLDVTLPDKGRLVVKKSENADGPWPKALITKWSGPSFKVRLYGTTESRYIKVYLTEAPTTIQISAV